MKRTSLDTLAVLQDLWALAHALESRSKWMLKAHGVSGPQRLLVRVVREHPGLSPGEAARYLRLDPGTVSRLMAGLLGAGLLQRSRDRLDQRRLQLQLTDRGRRVASLSTGTVEDAVDATVAASTHAEVATVRAFVRRLTDELAARPRGREHAVGRRAAGRSRRRHPSRAAPPRPAAT